MEAKAPAAELLLCHLLLQLTPNPGFGYPDRESGAAYSLILRFLARLNLFFALDFYHHARAGREIPFGSLFHLPISWFKLQYFAKWHMFEFLHLYNTSTMEFA